MRFALALLLFTVACRTSSPAPHYVDLHCSTDGRLWQRSGFHAPDEAQAVLIGEDKGTVMFKVWLPAGGGVDFCAPTDWTWRVEPLP